MYFYHHYVGGFHAKTAALRYAFKILLALSLWEHFQFKFEINGKMTSYIFQDVVRHSSENSEFTQLNLIVLCDNSKYINGTTNSKDFPVKKSMIGLLTKNALWLHWCNEACMSSFTVDFSLLIIEH